MASAQGAGLEDIGIVQPKPVVALREAVGIIRDLLAGGTVEHRGQVFTITKAKLVRVPQQQVPLMIGTRSPQTMRLAGELADIAVIGARYWSPAMVQRYRQWLTDGATRVGRTLFDLEVAPRLTLCTSHDGALAKRSVKFYAAYYLTLLQPPDLAIDPTHFAKIQAAVQQARGWYFDADVQYPEELHVLISDDIVSRFAIAGTPAECMQQVKRILELGFTSLSMNLAAVRRGSMYDGLKETITTFGEVLPEIRQLAVSA